MLLASAGAGSGFMLSAAESREAELTVDAPAVKSVASGIEITGAASTDCHFSIYSITGQLVKTVDVAASTRVTVDLPKGYYIVKCSAWARKVVVR